MYAAYFEILTNEIKNEMFKKIWIKTGMVRWIKM